MEEKYDMKSDVGFYKKVNHLRVDNTNKNAKEVVAIMIEKFGL